MKKFNNQLVRQTGEHLVVAELGRRGIIATPFAGNVPDIDILAYEDGIAVPLQVKSITKGRWSFNAKNYLAIEWRGDVQTIMALNSSIDRNLIFVFVVVGEKSGKERIYVASQGDVQDIIGRNHSAFLKLHDGVRPRNPMSTHTAISENDLADHRDRWELMTERFHLARASERRR